MSNVQVSTSFLNTTILNKNTKLFSNFSLEHHSVLATYKALAVTSYQAKEASGHQLSPVFLFSRWDEIEIPKLS